MSNETKKDKIVAVLENLTRRNTQDATKLLSAIIDNLPDLDPDVGRYVMTETKYTFDKHEFNPSVVTVTGKIITVFSPGELDVICEPSVKFKVSVSDSEIVTLEFK